MFFLPYDIMDIIILEISKSVLIMIEQIHSFIFYIHSYTYSLNYYNFFSHHFIQISNVKNLFFLKLSSHEYVLQILF